MPANRSEHEDPRDAQLEYLTGALGAVEQRVAQNEKAIALIVETSVADGIRKAVADPKTWDAFFQALGNRAQQEAGQVAVGGAKWLVRRLFWGAMAFGIIYAVGGWNLLVKAVSGFTAH